MTENEAIMELEDYVAENDKITISIEAVTLARKALEKVQKFESIGTVEELQKSVKEEDVLKFYYIESEDKYVVGKRIDTLYYAEVGKTGLCFYMSRYLPWGKDGYPSEPKEIPFFDWFQGFMKKEYGSTIEELKALKEKDEPKKVVYQDEEKERLVKSDEDCADCLCRVCARNSCNDSYNIQIEGGYANCSCNCNIGDKLIETEDDCPKFIPDEDQE